MPYLFNPGQEVVFVGIRFDRQCYFRVKVLGQHALNADYYLCRAVDYHNAHLVNNDWVHVRELRNVGDDVPTGGLEVTHYTLSARRVAGGYEFTRS